MRWDDNGFFTEQLYNLQLIETKRYLTNRTAENDTGNALATVQKPELKTQRL